MKLSIEDLNILVTRHANSYESAQLRDRLIAEGLHFCSHCKSIKPAEGFPKSVKGRGGHSAECHRCGRQKKHRTTGFIPHGPRYKENDQRQRERDPEGYRERQREACRRYFEIHRRSSTPRKGPMSPQAKAASKRRNFDRRKALGMSGRQANYMASAPEFDESWNAIKR